MIKIAALNDESEEDSGSEEEVSREALEQIALQQYTKALDLQRKGSLNDATQLLKDLLETELLYDVKKPVQGEKVSGPLFNLKYLCYKNLASMLSMAGQVDAAIEAYTCATELDDTDLTLWYRFGLVCFKAQRYECALYAFERGEDINPRHWPCIDKIVTLLLGMDMKEQCIAVIHDALKLDACYLRGIAYRKHIYTVYRHMKEYMEYLNPIYKWDEKDDEPINEEIAKKLIKEAEEIYDSFIEQQRAQKEINKMPNLVLQKPINRFTWESVGESLVHMHKYISENGLSHAAFVELVFNQEVQQKKMEICEDHHESDSDKVESKPEEVDEKPVEIVSSENEMNDMSDKEKPVTDSEKVESDIEMVNTEQLETAPEHKEPKKTRGRRRGSALSFLEQWEWCTKRRSSRKKNSNKQDNIYDILRRMVPLNLETDNIKNNDNPSDEPSLVNLENLFEGKEESEIVSYFNSEEEERDVKEFIKKYMEQKRDMIDMLKDYVKILSQKWKMKWPRDLSKFFVQANECYNNHIEIPACTDDNIEDLLHYTAANLLVEEFVVNDKLTTTDEKVTHSLSVIDNIEFILSFKPEIYGSTECLEVILRQLWLKMHIYIINKEENFALDCLYQLSEEFEAMGEHKNSYHLHIINFRFKPIINKYEVLEYIKFLERNKKLSTVNDLFKRNCHEEVLAIIIDSFEHCRTLAKEQESEMSLDFAVQLSFILDSYWALEKVGDCLRWSFICLHEALKHYFRFPSGSPDYAKWTLAVVKILSCMEHLLSSEGFACLDAISPREMSQGLEDLIRIIGHQMETKTSDMPLNTVSPWIIMHYILQREEDQGRGRPVDESDKSLDEEISNPLMVLFIAHEKLGSKGWCDNSNGKLLYFILDTVVPLLRSPALSKSLETICQYMEQCVYCLYGHPANRKNKVKYVEIHNNISPHTLDWVRAQQLYEIFRPPILPALEGKLTGITADIETLFHRILGLLPNECDPQKYVPDLEKYIKGIDPKLPLFAPLLPFKIKDIYFLLGDYYFKKEEGKLAVKYNMLDVIINKNRLESWAEISLAKAVNLERVLNSCKNLNNEKEFLNPAKSTIRCFKRSLEIDPYHCNLWIEYGNFVYSVHSFVSRLLKQASESLSMEDFEALERQKENLLDTTQKCFTNALDLNNSVENEKANEDSWLLYYMLGKVAEKQNKPPSIYLNYYMKGVKSLREVDATYPLKINYSSPTQLCIEVLELHYRIHASILKYIEQHENKPIPTSVGKVFLNCIEEWQQGPFTGKAKKENAETKSEETSVQAANILKRSISDAGEEDNQEAKKLKLESAAAKVRRSASYDTERIKDVQQTNFNCSERKVTDTETKSNVDVIKEIQNNDERDKTEQGNAAQENVEKDSDLEKKEVSSSSSSSSSDSSSSESSSDSSDSARVSESSSKSSNETKPITEEEIMKIVSGCLDALEDCASRFPPHYKAIYRLAHYHFYYKKGKDIERCRDLMLSSFTSRSGQKLGGLFSEKKTNNFFNNIWKIPLNEVDRGGSFAFHMNRSVLLTMEILKEIDDHKTLLDLSIHLQRIPEPDKKYLRDSDREDLAQQAFSLCVQALKGQLVKFSQQPDIKSNEVERQALKSLMLDIYRSYQKVQKQPLSKQFVNLLIDAYKLITTTPINESMNLVDLSMKYCQSMNLALKQQALAQANLDKTQTQKKQTAKSTECSKITPTLIPTSQSKSEQKPQPTATLTTAVPKLPSLDITASFQDYMPMLAETMLSQQRAALSYLSNMSALANFTSLPNPLQFSAQNSFQAEFYRQFLSQGLSSFNPPPTKKQKRAPKPTSSRLTTSLPKHKFTSTVTKATSTPVITSMTKSATTSLTPSMGTVLQTLPASMTANLPSYAASKTNSLPSSQLPSVSLKTTVHTKPVSNQVSPGKTLQEKLAERQKNIPVSKASIDISASISRLPSSLTITKTSKSGPKKPEVKKSISFHESKPKVDDEIIVLDDDD
ncbi:calcineurin-binding protein cabin-1-like [Pieris brassicae]|uniref:calcineurin-binding protein cabin-1-like n=1 Tax=Pieris brassicae TaxID=7116 RepID=UPI001E660B35|nr:calcineurin-binding protein cabin-1-like [Pieris brassicae]